MPSSSSSLRKMRFAPEQESQFQQFFAEELLTRAQWAGLAAIGMMLVFATLDMLLMPPSIVATFLGLRLAFVIVPLALVSASTYQPRLRPYMQMLWGWAAMSAGLAVVAMVCIARRNGTPIDYEGIILIVFYFYCCGGLRMRTACVAGWTVALVYPLADWQCGLGQHAALVRALFLVTTNVVGMVSCVIVEHAARRNFMMQQRLRDEAQRDFLTGLLNRRALTKRLQWLWRLAGREQRSLYVAMVDVDYFKQFNDHYGHAEGDYVLQQVTQVLQLHTQRPLDVAARYGGEEFVCVWSGNSTADVQQLLARLHADIQALGIAHARSPIAKTLTLSIGWVEVPPGAGLSIKEALAAADAALYAAKAQGRNRSVQAQKSPQAAGDSGVEVERSKVQPHAMADLQAPSCCA